MLIQDSQFLSFFFLLSFWTCFMFYVTIHGMIKIKTKKNWSRFKIGNFSELRNFGLISKIAHF